MFEPRRRHTSSSRRMSGLSSSGVHRSTTRANRCGECRHERLEVRDVAGGSVLLASDEGEPEGVLQLSELETAQAPGEIDAGAEQERDHRHAPDERADAADQGLDCLHEGSGVSSSRA